MSPANARGAWRALRSCRWSIVVGLVAAGAAPAAARAQTPLELSGVVNVVVVDPAPGRGTPTTAVSLSTDAGAVYTVADPDAVLRRLGGAAAARGRRVRVTGRAFPAARGMSIPLEVASVTLAGPQPAGAATAAAAAAGTVGERRFVTILCYLPDDPTTLDRTRYVRWMGASEPGAGHYWRALSEGRLTVVSDASDVVGPFAMPHPGSHYGLGRIVDHGALVRDCTAAADADVDFSRYDGINMQFNATAMPASYGGSWYLTLDGVARSWHTTWLAPWSDHGTYMHEIGHSLGLPHSGTETNPYASDWDVMSNSGRHDPAFGEVIAQGTIAHHKAMLGWLPPERLVTVEPGAAPRTLRVGRGERWPADASAILVRVPKPDGSGHYTVETRRHLGYDRLVPAEAVVLHHVASDPIPDAHVVDVDGDRNANNAGAIWYPGETFHDAAGGIAVAIEGADADGAVVTVRHRAVPLRVTLDLEPDAPRDWGAVVARGGNGAAMNLRCPGDCDEPIAVGEAATLAVETTPGWRLAGWSGACSGAGPCTVTTNGTPLEVRAVIRAARALAVSVAGEGTVTSEPGGIACPGDCEDEFARGGAVRLVARPGPGRAFAGWDGACAASGFDPVCTLTLDAAASTGARFVTALRIAGDSVRPPAPLGAAYADTLRVLEADASAVRWEVRGGALPAGLALDAATGVVHGIPTVSGTARFTVVATVNGGERLGVAPLRIDVAPAPFTAARVVEHLLGDGTALTAAEAAVLDNVGNRNGIADVGDLRIWTRANQVTLSAGARRLAGER